MYYGNTIIAAAVSVLLMFLLVSVASFLSHISYFDNAEKTETNKVRNCFLSSRLCAAITSPITLPVSYALGISSFWNDSELMSNENTTTESLVLRDMEKLSDSNEENMQLLQKLE